MSRTSMPRACGRARPAALLVLADPATAGPIAYAVQRVGLDSMLAFDAEQVRARLRTQPLDIAVVLLDTQIAPMADDDLVTAIRDHTQASILTLHADTADTAETADTAALAGAPAAVDGTDQEDPDGLPLDAPVESIAARAHALARAHCANPGPLALRWGELRLYPAGRQAYIGRDVLTLTPSQFAVLATLIQAAGTAVQVERIAEVLYGRGHPLDDQRVRAHIVRLRRAIRAVRPSVADLLVTVRASGYRLLPPTELR